MTQRRLAATYFFVQAVSIAGWWALLVAVPAMRERFTIRGSSFAVLGSFAPGDLALIVLGSVIVGARQGRGWSLYLAWLVNGALLYATCFAVAAAAARVCSPLDAALMIPASAASLTACVIFTRDAHAQHLPAGSST